MASKKTKKRATKKVSSNAPATTLSAPQTTLLKKIAPNKGFEEVSDHHKTQQALIDRELAVTNSSGTKIRPTPKGRKLAKKL